MSLGDLLGRIGAELNIGPQKYRKRDAAIADAMRNYDPQNPQATLEAIYRESPEAADAFFKNINNQKKVEADMISSQATASRAPFQNREDASQTEERQRRAVLGLIGSGNDKTGDAVLDRVREYANARGIDLTPYGIPDKWDSQWAQDIQRFGINPDDQARIDETARHNRASEIDRDDDRVMKAILDGARLNVQAANTRVGAANTGVAAARVGQPRKTGQTRSSVSAPTVAPPASKPPRFKGDTIGSGANKFFSPDGKTWRKM